MKSQRPSSSLRSKVEAPAKFKIGKGKFGLWTVTKILWARKVSHFKLDSEGKNLFYDLWEYEAGNANGGILKLKVI